MIDPIFWLGLSILLVAVSLTAVLVVTIPAIQELARAARSAEKLFDTLSRELPPTLESIRLTGMEISDLTDEMNKGVQSASHAIKQVDDSLDDAKQQARKVKVTVNSVVVGIKAGWKTLTKKQVSDRKSRRKPERLPPSERMAVEFWERDPLPSSERSTSRRSDRYPEATTSQKPEATKNLLKPDPEPLRSEPPAPHRLDQDG